MFRNPIQLSSIVLECLSFIKTIERQTFLIIIYFSFRLRAITPFSLEYYLLLSDHLEVSRYELNGSIKKYAQ